MYVITDPTHPSTDTYIHTNSLSLSLPFTSPARKCPSPNLPSSSQSLLLSFSRCSRQNMSSEWEVSRRAGSRQTSCDCSHLSFLHLARMFGTYLFFYNPTLFFLHSSSLILVLLTVLSLILLTPSFLCIISRSVSQSVNQSVHTFACFDVLFFSLKDPSGLGSMKMQRGGSWDFCQGILLQCFSKNIEPGSFFSIL